MAVLHIKKYPDPVLRQKAKVVTTIRQRTLNLIANMIETMYKEGGIGLAANQVGVLQRIIVADLTPSEEQKKEKNSKEKNNHDVLVLINPEILSQGGENTAEEGCLSFPQITGQIKRATQIKVGGANEKGEILEIVATGLPARIIQHEIDHLNGVLFIDKMDMQTKEANRDNLNMLKSGGSTPSGRSTPSGGSTPKEPRKF